MNWELVWQFTLRDLRARYKQSYLGAVWVLFQPLSQVAIFSLVFSRHFAAEQGTVPYVLFVLTGMVPWTAFASTVNTGSSSLLNNAQLLKKIYFPREVLPISAVVSGLVDFLLSFSFLLVYQLAYIQRGLPTQFYWVVGALFLQTVFLLGVCFLMSPIVILVRDLRHAIPTLVLLGMFLTPVVYPASKAPLALQSWLFLNPMSTILSAYRCALLGTTPPSALDCSVALCFSVGMFLLGYGILKKSESILAEIL